MSIEKYVWFWILDPEGLDMILFIRLSYFDLSLSTICLLSVIYDGRILLYLLHCLMVDDMK